MPETRRSPGTAVETGVSSIPEHDGERSTQAGLLQGRVAA